MPRVLVTGCSTGFGRAIALHALDQGWEVVASMRHPSATDLPDDLQLRVLPLDVRDEASVAAAMAEAGPLDALVNNAGIGLLNAVEGTTLTQAREVFETNFLGLVAVTKAALPGMRERGRGVIVNVSSSVTLRTLPALSIYTASKAAVNAFTEGLELEIAPFGLRARIVLPGAAPTTSFGTNAMARHGLEIPEPYSKFVHGYLATLQSQVETTESADVARAVWQAVTDPAAPMRIPAGADAQAWFRDARC